MKRGNKVNFFPIDKDAKLELLLSRQGCDSFGG